MKTSPATPRERAEVLFALEAKALAWKPRSGCCEAGYELPKRGACRECGAGADGPCGRAYDKPPYEFRRAVLTDALPLIRDLQAEAEGLREALAFEQNAYQGAARDLGRALGEVARLRGALELVLSSGLNKDGFMVLTTVAEDYARAALSEGGARK